MVTEMDAKLPTSPLFGNAAAGGEPQALAGASVPRQFARFEYILEQGKRPAGLFVLCSGVARGVRMLQDGRQQIVAMFVPGDFLDCTPLPTPSRISVSALTPSTVIQISYDVLEGLQEKHPGIARILWNEAMRNAAIQQEWMVALGRLTAYGRLAHFICELSWRLRMAGLATEDSCDFPLTQSDLADALGLSVVHVNRILQQMRKDNLVTVARGRLTILDPPALRKVAEFDPGYLRCGVWVDRLLQAANA